MHDRQSGKLFGRVRRRRAAAWTVDALEHRTLLSAIWTGTGDGVNWTDPSNWAAQALPGPNDDVVINNTGSTSVKLGSGTQIVHSVNTSAPLTITGGTLGVATTLQTSTTLTLAGGTIQSADIVGSAAAQLISTSGTLNGTTLDLTVTIPSGGRMTVQNGLTVNQSLTLASSSTGGAVLTFQGGQTLAGAGQLMLGGTSINNSVDLVGALTAPLTIAQGFTIHGQGTIDAGGQTIVNQGAIAADVTGQSLQITDGALTNQGALVAGPGTLNLHLLNGWSNTSSGKLDVEGGTLQLGGAFTTAGLNLATFTRNGGTVSITGTLDNSNAILPLSPSIGSWVLGGGTITGGTITTSNGAQLVPSSGTLVGVTLNTDLTIAARSQLDVKGGITIDGTLALASDVTGGSILTFDGAQTVGGSGQILMGGTSVNDSISFSQGLGIPLVVAAGFPIHGMGTIGLGAGTLLNHGTITADIAGQRLNITNGSLTNQGTLAVASQATLLLSLNNGFTGTSAGRIDVEGGALQLGGALTTAGLNLPTFINNGGSVAITGSLDNSNATLALSAATGSWALSGGTITGGHVSEANNAQLIPSTGTLSGVTLDSDITIPTRASLTVQSGLTLNATLTLASDATGGSVLTFVGGQTVAGTGQILLGGSSNNNSVDFTNGGANPLVIGSGILVHGRGTVDLGSGGLTSQGQIAADVSGQSLTLRNGAMGNQGVLSAQSQGTLVVNLVSGWNCNSGGRLDVQGGSLQLGGNFSTPGLNLPGLTRAGGSISITGTLDNTGATFALTSTTGSWTLAGGTLTGGHITTSGGALLVPSFGTLNGVTIDSDTTIAPQSTLQIQGDLTLNAVLTINGDATGTAQLSFLATGSVTGTGQIAMTGSANNSVAINAPNATVTLGSGITLHGQGSVQGLTGTTLANQGTILADVSGQTLQITVPNFTSQGTATTANGGILSIASTNSITVSSGNIVVSPGVSPNLLAIAGGTVTFAGTLPISLRSLSLSGGTIAGSAPITLAGPANWIGGTIGGTGGITVPPAITLTVSGAAPHLATTAFNNTGTVNLTDGALQLDGGGNQGGTFALGTTAMLSLGGTAPDSFAAASSISGAGTFAVQDAASVAVHGAYDVGATTVSGTGSFELVPGARVASIGTLTVDGGTFICGDAGLDGAVDRLGPTVLAAGAGGIVNVLTAAVISGGTTLLQPGWTLSIGSSGLTFTGSTDSVINLSSDPATPARLALGGDVTFAGTGGTASIHSIGTGAVPGQVDLGGAQRSFVVNEGSATTDLAIFANVTNGSLRTSGSGRMQVASPSGFAGGVTIAGGTLEIDDPAALGTGAIHFAGGTLALGAGVAALGDALTAAPADSISIDVGAVSRQVPGLTLGSALNVTGLPGGALVVAGPVALQNDVSINNSVPLTIGGAVSGTFAVVKTSTGTLTLGPATTLAGQSLQLTGGMVVFSPSATPTTNTLRSLTIAPTSRLDIGNSTLLIDYSAGPSPADTIRSYLTTAFDGGGWSGSGLGTSGATPMLGYADSADGLVAGLPAHTVVVRPAIAGDANLDGKVDFADLLDLAQHYGQNGATWDKGDMNYDAAVNFSDLLLLAQHYGQTAAATAPPAFSTADVIGVLQRASRRRASLPHVVP